MLREEEFDFRGLQLFTRLDPQEKNRIIKELEKISSPPFVIYPDLPIDAGTKYYFNWVYSLPQDRYVFENSEPIKKKEFPIDLERSLVLEGKILSLRKGSQVLESLEDVSNFLYLTNGFFLFADTEDQVKLANEDFEVVAERNETRDLSTQDKFSVHSGSGNFVLFIDEYNIMRIYSLNPFRLVLETEDVGGAAFVGKFLVSIQQHTGRYRFFFDEWDPENPRATGSSTIYSALANVDHNFVVLDDEYFLVYNSSEATATLWRKEYKFIPALLQSFIGNPTRIGSSAFALPRLLYRKSGAEYPREPFDPTQTLPGGKYYPKYPPKKKRVQIAKSLMTPQTLIPLDVVEIIVDFCVEFIAPEGAINSS
jgi:hypothetical protein